MIGKGGRLESEFEKAAINTDGGDDDILDENSPEYA